VHPKNRAHVAVMMTKLQLSIKGKVSQKWRRGLNYRTRGFLALENNDEQ